MVYIKIQKHSVYADKIQSYMQNQPAGETQIKHICGQQGCSLYFWPLGMFVDVEIRSSIYCYFLEIISFKKKIPINQFQLLVFLCFVYLNKALQLSLGQLSAYNLTQEIALSCMSGIMDLQVTATSMEILWYLVGMNLENFSAHTVNMKK